MKSFFLMGAVLFVAVVLLASGCHYNDPNSNYPSEDVVRNPPTYVAPPHDTSTPVLLPTPAPEPESSPGDFVYDSALEEFVALMNGNIDRMSGLMIGLFTAYSEARGDNTIAVVFQAVDSAIDYVGIAVHISDQVASYVSPVLPLMLAAGIEDPVVILEFLNVRGDVIYIREFTLDGEPVSVQPLPAVDLPSSGGEGDDMAAILRFLESQQATIERVRQELGARGTFSINAVDSRTISCVVSIADKNLSSKATEERVNEEVMPMLKATFKGYIPILDSMGVVEPRVIVEAYGADGALIVSTTIS